MGIAPLAVNEGSQYRVTSCVSGIPHESVNTLCTESMVVEEINYRRFEVFQLAPPRTPFSWSVCRFSSALPDGLRLDVNSSSDRASRSMLGVVVLRYLQGSID